MASKESASPVTGDIESIAQDSTASGHIADEQVETCYDRDPEMYGAASAKNDRHTQQEEGDEETLTRPVSGDATTTVLGPTLTSSSTGKVVSHLQFSFSGARPFPEDLSHVSRAEKESAIERARQRTQYEQLLEHYQNQSTALHSHIQNMSRILNQPQAYNRLKSTKKAIQFGMKNLEETIEDIRRMKPHETVEEDFTALEDSVKSLLGQYRLLFPRESSQASSSIVTSTTTSQRSRKTIDDVKELTFKKRAVEEEGKRATGAIEEEMAQLRQKIKEEQDEIDRARRQSEEAKRQAEEEARRRTEEVKRKAEEEARKREEALKQAEFERQEVERQAKSRLEEAQLLLDKHQKEKDRVVKVYKDKEWQVVTDALLGFDTTDGKTEPHPDLPKFSMLEAFMDESTLKPIKSEGTSRAIATNPSHLAPQYSKLQEAPTLPTSAAAMKQCAPQWKTPIEQYGAGPPPVPVHLPLSTANHAPMMTNPGGSLPLYTTTTTAGPSAPLPHPLVTEWARPPTGRRVVMTSQQPYPNPTKCPHFQSSTDHALVHQSTLRPHAAPYPDPNLAAVNCEPPAGIPAIPVRETGYPEASYVSQETASKTLADAIIQTRLPVAEPPVFKGDPLTYPSWRSAFDLLVQRQNIPDAEKLIYLQKYVGGAAEEAITGYFLLRSPAALEEALATLEQRFGNAFIVSRAFREKLDAWPTIKAKDGEGLRKFADFTKQTVVASRTVGQLKILDDAQFQKSLLSRLPEWIMRKWAVIVTETKDKRLRYPTFEELSIFLAQQASIQCEPVFGAGKSSSAGQSSVAKSIMNTDATPQLTDKEVEFVRSLFKKGAGLTGTVNTTQLTANDKEENLRGTSNPTFRCIFCEKNDHRLSCCSKLMAKSLVQRREFFFKGRLCFACGLRGHRARECRNPTSCRTCGNKHLTLLHLPEKTSSGQANDADNYAESNNGSARKQMTDGSSSKSDGVRAVIPRSSLSCSLSRTTMIVPVFVSTCDDPETEVRTYALLDTMSFLTFVSNTIGEHLKAEKVDTTLSLNTMTSRNELVHSQAIRGLRVRPIDSQQYLSLPLAYTTDNLSANPETIPTPETARKYRHLYEIADQLHPPQEDCTAGLLIGYDCAQALMPLEIIRGSPYAVKTMLGWSIVGEAPSSETVDCMSTSPAIVEVTTAPMVGMKTEESSKQVMPSPTSVTVAHVFSTQVREATTSEVLKMMERDFIETEYGSKSQEDVRFLKIMEDNIIVNADGHFEMPLPFRNEDPVMSDNRPSAVNRALMLKRQLEKNHMKREHYVTFMNDIISQGHAEKVPEADLDSVPRWYIPHHGVYNERKPNKIRVVFDCSTKYKGSCLNDHLLQGPDLINPLVGVLCRFRKGKVAFSCDVEKMYHQFYVTPLHRNYLRFLWWESGDISGPLVDYRMKVHLFGATSSPGCANYGLKKLAADYEEEDPQAAEFLKSDFYVDDGLHAEDEVETAVKVLKGAMHLCEQGKLHLHKVVSNSAELLSQFPASECSSSKMQDIGTNDTPAVERTLGLQWRVDQDIFTFSQDVKTKPVTRRGMLSTIASLYDPLGFIAPVILQGRALLQQVCKEAVDWDDPVPSEVEREWLRWIESLKSLHCIQIPRSFVPPYFKKTLAAELHHFSDASELGYGQCSYLRLTDVDGNVHCSLVMAKARVSPLKTVTIPRLELQAATLSVRMAEYLQTQLAYKELRHWFWTDSQIVLAYISNTQKKFPVFVANRVSKILSFTSASQWFHIATEHNPADLASRGKNASDLPSTIWFSGPKFIWRQTVPFPATKTLLDLDTDTAMCGSTSSVPPDYTSFEERCQRFSVLSSLLRGVGLILQCIARKKGENLTVLDARALAQRRLITLIQKELLAKPSKATANSMEQLGCQRRPDGLIVVEGRNARGRDDHTMPPVLLPSDSHLTTLIVEDCHQEKKHSGRTTTIYALRARGMWIIGVRRVVLRITKKCIKCRRLYGPPLHQRMADLPLERVTESSPFSYCGIDCFGPFLVKEGRKTLKRYGLIITCLSTRAVHIEVLDDMSTDAVLDALRRLIAIRGQVRQIRCDRGTNFVGASRELARAWQEMDRDSLKATLLEKHHCEWVFNPPAASHAGGVWERMIRSARRILDGLMTSAESRLTTSSLRTLMYEVMAILNSRPLSVESLEDPTGPLPLTPNHILTTKSTGILPPPGVFQKEDLVLRKQWRMVQHLADRFWETWRLDYLSSLQARRKWCQQQPNLEVGDVVVLREDGVCRGDWRLGRVTDVFPSVDGLVRRCRLRVPRPRHDAAGDSQSKVSDLERHVCRLTLLFRANDVVQTDSQTV